ncbi:MAG: hypothetical protein BGP11_07160 [Rhodobacterales bacterium 65-51]|uniref:hypothetical protein n=1 Tax=uncultured Gemmobacter sp. TaxID=1095917 RepID=UPI000966A2A8|nr:hypothetical protein [uncultured Gemmobacter sp.]OJY25547.1 MAG: hypothetical protein BGP11_07160 [Rhodobacterales bacterium 65-51]
MRHLPAASLCLALAACVPPEPPADGERIELSSGGAFSGSTRLVLTPDDRAVTAITGPFSDKGTRTVKQLRPGAFAAARDHILAHPIPKSQLKTGICEDYGADSILYTGPGREIRYVATCPNPAIAALDGQIRALLSGG